MNIYYMLCSKWSELMCLYEIFPSRSCMNTVAQTVSLYDASAPLSLSSPSREQTSPGT